jgi:outer membrane biosynthesis protein TonB
MRLSRGFPPPGVTVFVRRASSPARVAAGVLALALMAGAVGCAHLPWRHRPRPAPPPVAAPEPVAHSTTVPAPDTIVVADTSVAPPVPAPKAPKPDKKEEAREEKAAPPPTNPPTPVESVMTPAERKQALERTVADSTAAGQALRKCAGRTLLPDQESVYDTVRSLLVQVRAALIGGELWRAESLARKARQLSSSLNCP